MGLYLYYIAENEANNSSSHLMKQQIKYCVIIVKVQKQSIVYVTRRHHDRVKSQLTKRSVLNISLEYILIVKTTFGVISKLSQIKCSLEID